MLLRAERMQKISVLTLASKAGMYDPLKFFDANGNELQLNRGKSYIAFTYAGNCKVEG